MKKPISISVYITIIFVIQACNISIKTEEKNFDVISIDIKSSNEVINLTNEIDFVSYVLLETRDSCLLRGVKKMVVLNQELIILDDFVYIFDLQGQFKTKIGKKGKGPGEFNRIDDFIVDQKSGNIEMYDFSQNKVGVFTRKGEFIREFKFPFGNIIRFEKKDNGDYIAWKSLGNVDDENAFIGYKIHIGNFKDGFTEHRPCYQFDGNLRFNQSFSRDDANFYFWEALEDTIFEINSDNEFYKKYYIDFGINKTPKELSILPAQGRIFELRDNLKVATAIDNFYHNNRFTYFNFLYNKNQHNVFIKNGVILVGVSILCRDIKYSNFTYFNGSNLLASVGYSDKMSNSLKNALPKEINISDNPVITIFKLK